MIPFLTQIWMYASVIVPFSRVPERWGAWRYLYGLNPMGGVIESFRWCLFHHRMDSHVDPPWILIGIGSGVMILMIVFGLHAFKRMEQQFADIV
jgi:ABC-type polysaccharide/polyol phosphate export permease